MQPTIRVGTSGWQYRDWRGTVYPQPLAQRRWLEHYTTLFPTVEVNSTFYRLARETACQNWAATVPPGFEFVLKGSKFITHRLKLNRPEPAVRNFFEPVRPVLPLTPVVLWQLPPSFKRNPERLDEFLAGLPDHARYAVEFRDDDWFHEDVFDVLRRHNAANTWLSSSLTSQHGFVDTADFVYVRFHGLSEQPYQHDYSRTELEPWAERLRDVARQGRDAWVYFNNDYHGHAVRNGHLLQQLLGEAAFRPVGLPDADAGAA